MSSMLISMAVPNAAKTRTVSISTTSAQSAVLTGGNVVLQSDVACFVIRGENPTATTSCLPLLSGAQYRLTGIKEGEKLAFITSSGSGTVYYTEDV